VARSLKVPERAPAQAWHVNLSAAAALAAVPIETAETAALPVAAQRPGRETPERVPELQPQGLAAAQALPRPQVEARPPELAA